MTDAEKVAYLNAALGWCVTELYGLKSYMARKENGEYGVECAVCRREWFDQSGLIELDNARQILEKCGGTLSIHAKG